MNPRLRLSVLLMTVAPITVSAQVTSPNTGKEAAQLPDPAATEVWKPVPPIVQAPADGRPSDAIMLFDGSSLDAWESAKTPGTPAPWKLDGGAVVVVPRTGSIRTKAAFGDVQLHAEFRTPAEAESEGQGRGNSGILLMGKYEVQVLDSYENATYVNGQAGSIYKQHIPLVNATRPPGAWQTFDIVWIAPRFDAAGTLLSPARVTVFHNGVLVQHDVTLRGPTEYRGTPPYQAHPAKLPLLLQNHGDAVAFRNIWIREIAAPGETK